MPDVFSRESQLEAQRVRAARLQEEIRIDRLEQGVVAERAGFSRNAVSAYCNGQGVERLPALTGDRADEWLAAEREQLTILDRLIAENPELHRSRPGEPWEELLRVAYQQADPGRRDALVAHLQRHASA